MIPREVLKKIRQIELRTSSPEGCQKVAGGRSVSEDLRCAIESDAILKGSQNAAARKPRFSYPFRVLKFFSIATGGIAVSLRATAQPPATFWHAFDVQGAPVNLHLANQSPRFTSKISV